MALLIFLLAAAAFGVISYRFRWLTAWGSITASAFGFCLLWLGGGAWVVPLMVFFGSSSILSKVGKKSAKPLEKTQKRDDIRNATQVLANGGTAWLMLIVYAPTADPIWYTAFVGSLAAATSDTWATEIGRLAGGQPRSILTGRMLTKGLSGGITWQGTGGSVLGAVLIGFSCVPFYDNSILFCLIIGLLAGMAGSLIDSIIGAALQAKYRPVGSDSIVETRDQYKNLEKISGFSWVTNDLVNVFCTVSGAAVALLLEYLIR